MLMPDMMLCGCNFTIYETSISVVVQGNYEAPLGKILSTFIIKIGELGGNC